MRAVSAAGPPGRTRLRPRPEALPFPRPRVYTDAEKNPRNAGIDPVGTARTITFNSDKTDDDVRTNAPDGTAHLNGRALAPAGGPGEPPPGNAPPPKQLTLKVVASSSWNGRGFHNSGVFGNSFGPPLIEGYRVRFTRPGSYSYICTVHDHMKGTIVVG